MESTVSNCCRTTRQLLPKSTALNCKGRQDPQGAPEARNVRLLHDKARPHIAKKTSQKIPEFGWKILPHQPYSPVLAQIDYHLFRTLQHHLEEKRYDDRDHLKNYLRAFFASKSPEFYAKGIRDLVRRWQKVVDVDGDYFVE
ncbi:hypothetical protein RB195_017160 [Necator americanus]|uniref:Histone-lysine N-methyltransferase SETMAR n=1 Tax=Necator americanus TaxID=51031 RepID=A0ABR1C6F3_NECAM